MEWLWKPNACVSGLWFRLLGLVYLAAFGSLWPQMDGLVGAQGIVPAAEFLASVRKALGVRGFWRVPSIFWLEASDHALVGCCVIGCLGALLMVAGFWRRSAALLCYVLYLSITVVGSPFTNFQWDALLLECGFLAVFAGTPLLSWAYRFLLFRLMFESGLVKLQSQDVNWRNLHALRFHFLTQPLPNPVAYYAFHAPGWFLDACTAATLGIELVVPFGLFGPPIVRRWSAAVLAALQILIALTGNYAFFNLLTLALCVWALDDVDLGERFRRWLRPLAASPKAWSIAAGVATAVLMAMGLGELTSLRIMPAAMEPFEVVNRYGLFAVMTTTRPELIVEGSNDGVTWAEYQFRDKPGDVERGLPVVAPMQPRLDWQMWFAALGTQYENPWVGNLVYRLLTNEKSVTGLLRTTPIFRRAGDPVSGGPKYVRVSLYDYRFTTFEERRRTGAVWERTRLQTWFGAVSLK